MDEKKDWKNVKETGGLDGGGGGKGRDRGNKNIQKRKKGRRKSGRAQRLALARTAPRPLMGADGRSLPGTWNPIASLSQSQSRRVSRSRLRRGFLPFPPSVQVSRSLKIVRVTKEGRGPRPGTLPSICDPSAPLERSEKKKEKKKQKR